MDTEEKRAALEAAGKKVRKNATAETIDEMFDELQAEQLIAEEGIEDVPKTPPPFKPPLGSPAKPTTIHGTKEWEEALLRLQTNHEGEQTPAFVEWCRERMTREEFEQVYFYLPNI